MPIRLLLPATIVGYRPERIPAERFQPAARELFDFASLNPSYRD